MADLVASPLPERVEGNAAPREEYATHSIEILGGLKPVRRRPGMYVDRFLLACLAIAGCAPAPTIEAAPAAYHASPATAIAPGSDQAEVLRDLLAEAARVMQSPEFGQALVSVASELDLRMAPNGAVVDSDALVLMLRGAHPQVGYALARAQWRWPGRSRTIIRRGVPVVQIKRSVRDLWTSQSPASRSCAINTAAHELSHTLGANDAPFQFLIADWGYDDAPDTQHFASYTIGSVAQCTWLAQQGALTGTLRACIEANGTRDYSPPAC